MFSAIRGLASQIDRTHDRMNQIAPPTTWLIYTPDWATRAVAPGFRRHTGLWRWEGERAPWYAYLHASDATLAQRVLLGAEVEVRLGRVDAWQQVRVRGARSAEGYIIELARVGGPLPRDELWVPWAVYLKQPQAIARGVSSRPGGETLG